MLLWHGSRLTNWVGIISQGLRIAPPEAPSTGYMFGKGVYFADMSSKSATTALRALRRSDRATCCDSTSTTRRSAGGSRRLTLRQEGIAGHLRNPFRLNARWRTGAAILRNQRDSRFFHEDPSNTVVMKFENDDVADDGA
jgi:hypothetical protein